MKMHRVLAGKIAPKGRTSIIHAPQFESMGPGEKPWHKLVSGRIAIAFVLWSAAWIIFSDEVLHLILGNQAPAVVWRLETLKGLIYVVVTAVFLYRYVRVCEREAHEARAKSESRLQRLTESNLISICYWRADGQITDANDAFLSLLGYDRDYLQIQGLNWGEFTSSEYGPIDPENLKKLDAGGSHIVYEKEFIRRDGVRVPVVVGAAFLKGQKKRGIAYALDLTTLKQTQKRTAELEERLRQSQKLEAIGNLASGIAHDFNNLLNIIIGYTTLLLASLPPAGQSQDHASQILKASAKAEILVRKLLAFGRKQMRKPEILDLNEIVREFEKMLPRLLEETIELRFTLTPGLWPIEADRSQIEQVLLNLAVNARDAMPNGGIIKIATRNAADDRVLLTVEDTGIGMDEETKTHIFEPFFTTKSVGIGTGLGLSTVYGIVGQSGGEILVDSKVGGGSTFKIFLPRARFSRFTVVHGGRSQSHPDTGGSETILIAEDEKDLRSMLRLILETSGYKVLEAGDGQEAISVASQYQGTIDLLLTDLVMPRVGGQQAAAVVRSVRPGIKVLYITGYSDTKTLTPGWISESEILLEKPVRPSELMRRIRQLVDKSQRENFRRFGLSGKTPNEGPH